jgi:hypothetical protein
VVPYLPFPAPDINPFLPQDRTSLGQLIDIQTPNVEGDRIMKKLLILAVALSVMLTVAGFAQDMSKDSGMDKAAPAPLKNIRGTVKADGDKLTFVSDKDQKSWDVVNPETLKGHEGHHVELSAHVYADKGQIHVMSVKMLKSDKMSNQDTPIQN